MTYSVAKNVYTQMSFIASKSEIFDACPQWYLWVDGFSQHYRTRSEKWAQASSLFHQKVLVCTN